MATNHIRQPLYAPFGSVEETGVARCRWVRLVHVEPSSPDSVAVVAVALLDRNDTRRCFDVTSGESNNANEAITAWPNDGDRVHDMFSEFSLRMNTLWYSLLPMSKSNQERGIRLIKAELFMRRQMRIIFPL